MSAHTTLAVVINNFLIAPYCSFYATGTRELAYYVCVFRYLQAFVRIYLCALYIVIASTRVLYARRAFCVLYVCVFLFFFLRTARTNGKRLISEMRVSRSRYPRSSLRSISTPLSYNNCIVVISSSRPRRRSPRTAGGLSTLPNISISSGVTLLLLLFLLLHFLLLLLPLPLPLLVLLASFFSAEDPSLDDGPRSRAGGAAARAFGRCRYCDHAWHSTRTDAAGSNNYGASSGTRDVRR